METVEILPWSATVYYDDQWREYHRETDCSQLDGDCEEVSREEAEHQDGAVGPCPACFRDGVRPLTLFERNRRRPDRDATTDGFEWDTDDDSPDNEEETEGEE